LSRALSHARVPSGCANLDTLFRAIKSPKDRKGAGKKNEVLLPWPTVEVHTRWSVVFKAENNVSCLLVWSAFSL